MAGKRHFRIRMLFERFQYQMHRLHNLGIIVTEGGRNIGFGKIFNQRFIAAGSRTIPFLTCLTSICRLVNTACGIANFFDELYFCLASAYFDALAAVKRFLFFPRPGLCYIPTVNSKNVMPMVSIACLEGRLFPPLNRCLPHPPSTAAIEPDYPSGCRVSASFRSGHTKSAHACIICRRCSNSCSRS